MTTPTFKPLPIHTSAGPARMRVALRRSSDHSQRPLFVFLHGLAGIGPPQPAASFSPALETFLNGLGEGDDKSGPDWLLYDRFGAGESDKDPREGGHTLPLAVQDLRELLKSCAGGHGGSVGDETVDSVPIVFVAHSLGAAVARYYAQQYPLSNIQGILFLDPMIASTDFVSIYQPRPGENLSQEELQELEKAREINRRIFHPSLPNPEGFDRSNIASLLPNDDEPKMNSSSRRYPAPWITVVAHDAEVADRLGIAKRARARYLEPRWEQYNRSLLALTTPDRARGPIVAQGADHFIQVARPDMVAAEMRFLWDKVRGQSVETRS